MSTFIREYKTATDIIDQLDGDEVLFVILGSDDHQKDPTVMALKAASVPAMNKSFAYSREYAGFTPASLAARATNSQPKSGRPFLLLEFDKWDGDPLERRWLTRRSASRLRTLFGCTKLAVYLPGSVTSLQLAQAEDTFCHFADEKLLHRDFLSFRVIQSTEASGDLRLDHLFDYKRWINEEPDQLTSIEIGERLRRFAVQYGCQAKILDKSSLAEEQMNLLLAVGQASDLSPPRLVVLEKNLSPGKKPLVLIGKGITFDTGGINVKPFASHVNCMKNDMGGAALMSQVFMGLVRSGYSKPLVLVIPACENLVGERAMKPGSIITSHAKKRVYIEHTDAEGRLILADAISYANKYYDPKEIIVAATLTTASLRQFSGYVTPVHFAKSALSQELSRAGAKWGEKFVYFDAFIPFAMGNTTKAADLTNMGRLPSHAEIGGGSNVAAHFLREFSAAPLTHLDIFASCWNWSGDYPGSAYGATGAPFNSLFEALMNYEP